LKVLLEKSPNGGTRYDFAAVPRSSDENISRQRALSCQVITSAATMLIGFLVTLAPQGMTALAMRPPRQGDNHRLFEMLHADSFN
jgi:hypothetical protein